MDTSRLEYTAEDLISHKLQQSGILVAKPKFDREGTDLLAFLDMGDNVKFCRIQCKGRSLANSNSNVKLPKSYVTAGFVLFLYVEESAADSGLYCFFQSDLESLSENARDEYILSLLRNNYKAKLERYKFDDTKIKLIRILIKQAESSGEFRRLVGLNIAAQAQPATAEIYLTVENPDAGA
ncbi:hypothetical protein [Acaryochloris sp. CCMEE 5410]|uniref:hypothetical protein n=1 Tax=Acaryochloris sp. CCMEE 5410 TaxID=310037 RepID=UPI000248420F|nr:hypothetical protein [Acaryochloris sp. CCMEE 5410]